MSTVLAFGDVLEAVDALPLEEQQELMEVVRRRVVEQRRQEMVHEIAEAENEFDSGSCETKTVDELMQEILA